MIYRTAQIEIELRAKGEKVVSARISSEEPIPRISGNEILVHEEGAIDLTRARRGLPVLWAHDTREVIGKAQNIRLDGKALRADLFPGNSQRAAEIWKDIDAGIIKDVSIGYEIDQDSIERKQNSYYVRRWKLMEVSVVAIGADETTGIGRSRENLREKKNTMNDDPKLVEERFRVKEILAIGKRTGLAEMAEGAVASGMTLDEFREKVIEKISNAKPLDLRKPQGDILGPPTPLFARRGPFIGKRYAEIFGTKPGLDGWNSGDEFFDVITRRLGDPRLQRGHSEGVGPAGGYLLPSLVAALFIDNSLEESIAMPRAKIYPVTGDSLRVPAFEIGSHQGQVYGGITASWKGEGIAASETPPHLREMDLIVKKLFLYTTSTNELLQDSGMATVINQAFRGASAHFLDEAFICGNGVGKPQGVLAPSNPALLTQARNTASQVLYVDMCNMLGKLNPQSFSTAVWLAHPTVLPFLSRLIVIDGAGTSVAHVPLISENGEMRVVSRPVFITEKCSTLGSQADLALVDFSQYIIGLHGTVGVEANEGELFSRDMTSFRLTLRVDGQSAWDEPLTLRDGVSRVSPFVALQ